MLNVVHVRIGLNDMETADRLTVSVDGGEHRTLQRSLSARKEEVLSTSFSASTSASQSASSSVHRQLRQHRNSWPTIEAAAATAAAKAIKRK